jgi:hypothetical protein
MKRLPFAPHPLELRGTREPRGFGKAKAGHFDFGFQILDFRLERTLQLKSPPPPITNPKSKIENRNAQACV